MLKLVLFIFYFLFNQISCQIDYNEINKNFCKSFNELSFNRRNVIQRCESLIPNEVS